MAGSAAQPASAALARCVRRAAPPWARAPGSLPVPAPSTGTLPGPPCEVAAGFGERRGVRLTCAPAAWPDPGCAPPAEPERPSARRPWPVTPGIADPPDAAAAVLCAAATLK